MKVIGRTSDGFILEASEYEVRLLSDGSVRTEDQYGNLRSVSIGTTFSVARVIEHMHELKRREKSAKDGVSFLRGLADMLDKGIPDWVAEPEPQPSEKADG